MSVRILIIEKETLFRTNLAQRLKLENYTVFLSNKGSEAKKLIRRKNVDVILLCLMELKREMLSEINRELYNIAKLAGWDGGEE